MNRAVRRRLSLVEASGTPNKQKRQTTKQHTSNIPNRSPRHPFVRTFLGFDILPLVEFQPEEDIPIEDPATPRSSRLTSISALCVRPAVRVDRGGDMLTDCCTCAHAYHPTHTHITCIPAHTHIHACMHVHAHAITARTRIARCDQIGTCLDRTPSCAHLHMPTAPALLATHAHVLHTRLPQEALKLIQSDPGAKTGGGNDGWEPSTDDASMPGSAFPRMRSLK